MNATSLAIALGLAALIAACGETAKTPVAAATKPTRTAAATSGDMGDMGEMTKAPTATASIIARGHGKVTAIDTVAGTITLEHGPIPEARWPAMTMAFKATPAISRAVEVGDHVAFDLMLKGSSGAVTAIHKE